MKQIIKPIVGIFLCLLVFSLSAKASVDFVTGSWQQVKHQAQQSQKPIFVKVTASWCVNCRMMERDVFTDPTVAAIYNQNFVNYSVDFDTREGQEFAQLFDVNILPDLLFFDTQGNLLKRVKDGKTQSAMIDLAEKILNPKKHEPINPVYGEAHVGTYEQNLSLYESGHKKSTFLRNFAIQSKQKGKPYRSLANKYTMRMRFLSRDWDSNENMAFVYEFADAPQTKTIDVLLRHKEDFWNVYGRYNVEAKIKQGIQREIAQQAPLKNKKALNRSLSIIKKAELKDTKTFKHAVRLTYFEQAKNWWQYSREMDRYTKKSNGLQPTKLSVASWHMYYNCKSNWMLRKAKRWTEKALEIDPRFYNYEVYAHVLQKMGKTRKAKNAILKGMIAAKTEGKSTTKLDALTRQLDLD